MVFWIDYEYLRSYCYVFTHLLLIQSWAKSFLGSFSFEGGGGGGGRLQSINRAWL